MRKPRRHYEGEEYRLVQTTGRQLHLRERLATKRKRGREMPMHAAYGLHRPYPEEPKVEG